MHPRSHKKLLAGGLLTLLIGAGAAGIASAQSGGPTTTADTKGEDESPAYTSSVTAPDNGSDTGTDDEAAESASLEGLAKTTPEQAKTAALAAVPGTADKAELGNENGNVVYEVEVTGSDGKHTDVKVDAGNGAVLAQETDDENERSGGESGTEKDTEDAPAAG